MAKLVQSSLHNFNTLADDFKPIAADVIEAIPSTFTSGDKTFEVGIYIEWGTRDRVGDSKRSAHYFGYAFDFSIWLRIKGTTGAFHKARHPGKYRDASANYTNTYPKNKNTLIVIPDLNSSINPLALYSIVSKAASSNKCEWGGGYSQRGGGYDPIHIEKVDFPRKKNKSNTSPVYALSSVPPKIEGEYKGEGETQSIETQVSGDLVTELVYPFEVKEVKSNGKVYIGYGLIVSDLQAGSFDNLGGTIDLPEKTIMTIEKYTGKVELVENSLAIDKATNPESITITEQQANDLLVVQLLSIRAYLKKEGIDLSSMPVEISTPISSYFYGKDIESEASKNAIEEFKKIAISKEYSQFADYIERELQSESDLYYKNIRLAEVSKIRSYNPNQSKQESLIASMNEPSEAFRNSKLEELQVANQTKELAAILEKRKISTATPSSSEYDSTFDDINVTTLDSIGTLMQAHQVNTDVYFGGESDEYTERIKVKNFYEILSRTLNITVSELVNILETELTLKHKTDMDFANIYQMLPYSNGLALQVKKNAVSRCEYRIRLLEHRIKKEEGKFISYGLTAFDSWGEILAVAIYSPVLTAIGLVAIQVLYENLISMKLQLKLEKRNLVELKRDVNRY